MATLFIPRTKVKNEIFNNGILHIFMNDCLPNAFFCRSFELELEIKYVRIGCKVYQCNNDSVKLYECSICREKFKNYSHTPLYNYFD